MKTIADLIHDVVNRKGWSVGGLVNPKGGEAVTTLNEHIEAMQRLGNAGISGAEAGRNLKEAFMNDKDRLSTGAAFIEMYDSLHQATQYARGSGGSFTPNCLDTMTVMELFNQLATNGVRFYCNKTHSLVKLTLPTHDPRQCKKEDK